MRALRSICVKVIRVNSAHKRGGNLYAAKSFQYAGKSRIVWSTAWICMGLASVPEVRTAIEQEYRGKVRSVWIAWPDGSEMLNETMTFDPVGQAYYDPSFERVSKEEW